MRSILPPLILFAATIAFGFGLVLPMVQVDRLYFFSERPSLVSLIAGLWSGGDRLIAGLVALFSVVFPAAKLAILHMAAYAPERAHLLHLLGALSKWSMMDVLVVALVIFAAKTSGLGSAAALPGLWFYASAAFLAAGGAALVQRRAP